MKAVFSKKTTKQKNSTRNLKIFIEISWKDYDFLFSKDFLNEITI